MVATLAFSAGVILGWCWSAWRSSRDDLRPETIGLVVDVLLREKKVAD